MTPRAVLEEEVSWGPSGLVPAVVQDFSDGRVLMVAYVDAEALAATLASGEVHFHSRSRDRLWRKGESSGNVLRLVEIDLDCDGDALLVQATPAGPTCHRGTRSCFDPTGGVEQSGPAANLGAAPGTTPSTEPAASPTQGFAWLETLWSTIDSRAGADPSASYTARLIAAGVDGPARKVVEEATEVLMAAKDDATAGVAMAADSTAGVDRRPATSDALTGEVADLLYHTLVLLRERGLPPGKVIDRLRERHKN